MVKKVIDLDYPKVEMNIPFTNIIVTIISHSIYDQLSRNAKHVISIVIITVCTHINIYI